MLVDTLLYIWSIKYLILQELLAIVASKHLQHVVCFFLFLLLHKNQQAKQTRKLEKKRKPIEALNWSTIEYSWGKIPAKKKTFFKRDFFHTFVADFLDGVTAYNTYCIALLLLTVLRLLQLHFPIATLTLTFVHTYSPFICLCALNKQ